MVIAQYPARQLEVRSALYLATPPARLAGAGGDAGAATLWAVVRLGRGGSFTGRAPPALSEPWPAIRDLVESTVTAGPPRSRPFPGNRAGA